MDTQPFRVVTPTPSTPVAEGAVSVGTKKGTDTAPAASTEGMPINLHADLKGTHYTAEYFGLQPFLDGTDITGIQDDIPVVDNFILDEMKDKNMEQTPEAYQEILDEIGKQIGKYDNEKKVDYFRRVTEAVKAIKRLRAAKVQPVLTATSLTPAEYAAIHGAR